MTKTSKKGRKASKPYVICRCTNAGVHAGYLQSLKGQTVTLEQSRRLWYWKVPMGAPAFLSGVATHGLGEECQIGANVTITLTEVCEVIHCSATAEKSISEYDISCRKV